MRLANTLSNAAYAAVAAALVAMAGLLAWPVAAPLVLLTVGSAGFHWTRGRVRLWHQLDLAGMYGVLLGMAAFAALNLWPVLTTSGVVLALPALVLVVGGVLGFAELSSTWVVPILGLPSFALLAVYGSWIDAVALAAAFGVAYAARQLGDDPGHGQTHPLWHVATAAVVLAFCAIVHYDWGWL